MDVIQIGSDLLLLRDASVVSLSEVALFHAAVVLIEPFIPEAQSEVRLRNSVANIQFHRVAPFVNIEKRHMATEAPCQGTGCDTDLLITQGYPRSAHP